MAVEIGHIMYRASRVLKDNDIATLYGNKPLDTMLEIENILEMRLLYSVLYGGSTVQFCFIDRKRDVYVLKRDGSRSRNILFNFPSIFQGEFIVKDKIPDHPPLARLFHLTMLYITDLGLGGRLIGPRVEKSLPSFETTNELKMKMEISGR